MRTLVHFRLPVKHGQTTQENQVPPETSHSRSPCDVDLVVKRKPNGWKWVWTPVNHMIGFDKYYKANILLLFPLETFQWGIHPSYINIVEALAFEIFSLCVWRLSFIVKSRYIIKQLLSVPLVVDIQNLLSCQIGIWTMFQENNE